ncbi:MAG: VWA domain-containing protein [Akkermansiaceae bacterium]|nr:VWA domain-containing protein [Akkermansiaceae bacterium]
MKFLSYHHLVWVLPILLGAAAALYWSIRQRRQAIQLLTNHAAKCNLRTNASPLRRRILTVSLFSALVLTLLAALRPTGGTEFNENKKPAKNLIVLLDVSRSMGANDSDGLSRMDAAKLLLREFINTRPTDRIGLISFAGASYPECPTTIDRTMLLQRLDKLKPGSLPVGGTDINTALQEAQNLLGDDPPTGSAILVFSDGDNVTGESPAKVLEELKKASIPIIAAAFGKPGSPAPVPNSPLESTADHSTLNKLANATDGLYFAGIPSKVDAQIEELSTRVDTIEINGDNFAKEIYNRPLDLYAYPLTLALILLMIHLFLPLRSKAWHPLTALIALSFIFSPALKAAQYTDFDLALNEAKEEELPLAVIFTGSDWSQLSITFEKEILSHKVYQNWAKSKVITVLIDLPRTGIDKESRNARRALAAKFDITSYPMVIFLDTDENNLGTLSHDSKGAASWIKRANAILDGDSSVSDTAASIDYLPEAVKEQLENKDLTDTQRSIGYYNKGVEFERAEPDLELKSKDQFKLLVDLYSKAAEFSPVDRPDLLFKARLKLGLLHHRKGKSMVPNSQEEAMMKAMELQMEPVKMLEEALKSFRKGLALYKQAAPLEPANNELSTNFAVLYRDITRVQGYLDYLKAYQTAIETTLAAVTQEKRFLKSLEREVTTKEEVNKAAINESSNAIDDLVKKALAIKEKPTLLPEEGLKDYKLALEDIVLAPSPHLDRDLEASAQHIQDALDHLIDPQQMQPQQGEGEDEGDGEPGEGSEGGEEEDEGQGDKPDGEEDGDGDEEGEKPEESKNDADLRRSGKENGDLRDRLLERLGNKNRNKRIPRNKDH